MASNRFFRKSNNSLSYPVDQAGVSLIEVLVTAFILAIGLLGLAALQTNSLRYNQESYLRTIAVSQVNAMADRMRANSSAVADGFYDSLTAGTPDPNCTFCTPQQRAEKDFFEWNAENEDLLPAGVGNLTVNGNLYTITVYWDERRTGATGMNCSGNPDVDLACIRMDVQI